MLYQIDLPIALYTLLPLITGIPSLFFCAVFIRDAVKTRQRMFGYLTTLFLVYLLQHVLSVLQYFIRVEEVAKFNFIVTQALQIGIILIFSIILEMFEKNTPYTERQLIFAILAAITVGAMISSPTLISQASQGTYILRFDPLATESIFQAIFADIASLWLLITISRNYLKATVQKQKTLMKGMLLGTFITIVIGNTFPSIIRYVTTEGILLFDISLVTAFWGVFQDVGMIIVGIAFMRISKDPWLLQRQQVYFILVLSHEGINLYSKAFRPEISPTDMALFSGGFSAVTAMFRQVTKDAAQVKSIMFEGKELRLLNREKFVCALLVGFSTQASEVAHQKFANEFDAMFKEKLQMRDDGDVTAYAEADILANFYFS